MRKERQPEDSLRSMPWLMILMLYAGMMAGCGDVNLSSPATSSGTTSPSGTTNNTMGTVAPGADVSVCQGKNNLTKIPPAYVTAMKKYTTTNEFYWVNVCTEDKNEDGTPDFMVIESTNLPEHKSVYFQPGHALFETFDFNTNVYKFTPMHANQAAHAAGSNKIAEQGITMRIPIAPAEASTKTKTAFSTIGLALNGVLFFNESAGPGHNITDELFTFDQCSGHPQQSGVYHYHADPICLIRDMGGSVTPRSKTENTTTYTWIEDSGTNAGLLLGFLMDGFPVYGPMGSGEKDCHNTAINTPIDQYNGHSHCTADFSDPIYHYHVKTAHLGATNTPVFWITHAEYFGVPGTITNSAMSSGMTPLAGGGIPSGGGTSSGGQTPGGEHPTGAEHPHEDGHPSGSRTPRDEHPPGGGPPPGAGRPPEGGNRPGGKHPQGGQTSGGGNTSDAGPTRFDQNDKNKDGKISRDEFPGPDTAFTRLDSNRDGFISRAETEGTPLMETGSRPIGPGNAGYGGGNGGGSGGTHPSGGPTP